MLIRTRLFAVLISTGFLCAQQFLIGVTYLRAEEAIAGADRLTAAKQTKVALEQWDDRFAVEQRRLIDALDQAILNVPSGSAKSDFSNEREVLLLYVGVTDQLIKECDTVLTAQQTYLEIGHQYANNLANAGPTFAAAAAQCREFAAEEPYDDTRKDYICMADIFESLAARCEQLPTKFNPQVRAVEELHPYLQNGRQVLVRFRDVLMAIPVLKSDAEFDALDKRLKSYVESYERFRGSLRQLQQRLQPERPSQSNLNMAAFRPRSVASPQTSREPSPAIRFMGGSPRNDVATVPILAAQSASFRIQRHPTAIRQIVAFQASSALGDRDDRWCHAQALSTTIAVGDVFRVSNRDGGVRTVKVLREAPEANTNDSRTWYAVIVPSAEYRMVWKFATQL